MVDFQGVSLGKKNAASAARGDANKRLTASRNIAEKRAIVALGGGQKHAAKKNSAE
jgi:hypothetical protein